MAICRELCILKLIDITLHRFFQTSLLMIMWSCTCTIISIHFREQYVTKMKLCCYWSKCSKETWEVNVGKETKHRPQLMVLLEKSRNVSERNIFCLFYILEREGDIFYKFMEYYWLLSLKKILNIQHWIASRNVDFSRRVSADYLLSLFHILQKAMQLQCLKNRRLFCSLDLIVPYPYKLVVFMTLCVLTFLFLYISNLNVDCWRILEKIN